MRTIANLTGIAVEGPSPDVHCGFAMCDEPVPGFIRQMKVGITGMLLTCGASQVFVPASAFWELAEANDAGFKAPPEAVAKAARRVSR
jgi:hypothetical protein